MSKEEEKAEARTGDPETDKILAEMKEEGEELPKFAKETSDEIEPEEGKIEDEESDEEFEEEEEEMTSEDESNDEEEESEEEEEDPEEEQNHVPLSKYQRLKKKLREAEALNDKLKSFETDAEIGKEIKSFSEKHFNGNEEATKELLSLVQKTNKLPEDLRENLEELAIEAEDRKFWKSQEREFRKDFEKNVLPLIYREEGEDVDATATYEWLNKVSWTPKNAQKSLVEIYLSQSSKSSSTGERSSNRRDSGKSVDYDNPSDEEMENMSDEDFDKFSEKMGKKSKMLITRSGY